MEERFWIPGEFETLELRDGDKERYVGKGVTKAVENINTIIAKTITGMNASDIWQYLLPQQERQWKGEKKGEYYTSAAKYNQLLRIEEELGNGSVYPGKDAFHVKK